ncbi:kinase-like domain-containing protein [Hyaloscypha finlandica]|nr:kinase-like domain-containing protein [Hyaloscypha finlandica]
MCAKVEYVGRSVPGLPTTDEVIELCRQNGFDTNVLKYPPNKSPIAYIKYGGRANMGEVRTQHYVSNILNETTPASGVKAPEVYLAFEYDDETYIVMEYIHGQTAAELLRDRSKRDWIYDLVAKAVTDLIEIPVPEDARPGPVGGGYIHHWFFRDNDAPREYASIDELQHHINKMLVFGAFGGSKEKVDFSNEQLCFCYSDIWEHNFIITEARQIYVIDFGDAAFLPTSFMSLVLQNPKGLLLPNISSRISFPESPNLNAMRRASYVFKIAHN